MKKISITFFAFLALLIISCGPSTKKAISYHDKIIEEHMAIQVSFDALDKSFVDYVPEDMNKAWDNAKQQTEKSIKVVSEMEDFDGSSTFKDAALKFFEVYNTVLDTYYSDMIKIYSIPNEEYTEENEAKFGELNDEMQAIYFPAFDTFKAEQEAFAKKYNFTIQQPE
jgi:hypothetical protein